MSEKAFAASGARTRGREAAGDAGVPWPWLVLAVVGLVGFASVTALAWARVTFPFDAPLRSIALQWSAWSGVWAAISDAANIPLIVIGVAIVAWLLWKGHRREAVLVIITLALVTAGSEGVKQLVHRPRPPGSSTVVPGVIYSFPSGHELESVTILGIVALLAWRSSRPRAARLAVAIAVALFCAAVAVARVAIDAHYPSDVLAGLLGGLGVLAVFALLTRPTEKDAAERGRGDTTPPGERADAAADATG